MFCDHEPEGPTIGMKAADVMAACEERLKAVKASRDAIDDAYLTDSTNLSNWWRRKFRWLG